MREIKFRGKRIDNSEWVYGMPYSFKPFYATPIYGPYYILMFNPEWDLEAQINYLQRPRAYEHLEDSVWKVIPESVGQYVEMKDVNKIEIYEGDRVKHLQPEDKNIYTVIWSDEAMAWGLSVNIVDAVANNDFKWPNFLQLKIIGNTTDNLELDKLGKKDRLGVKDG